MRVCTYLTKRPTGRGWNNFATIFSVYKFLSWMFCYGACCDFFVLHKWVTADFHCCGALANAWSSASTIKHKNGTKLISARDLQAGTIKTTSVGNSWLRAVDRGEFCIYLQPLQWLDWMVFVIAWLHNWPRQRYGWSGESSALMAENSLLIYDHFIPKWSVG